MAAEAISCWAFYTGWEQYQRLLIDAVAPLTEGQLQRTIGRAARIHATDDTLGRKAPGSELLKKMRRLQPSIASVLADTRHVRVAAGAP